MQWATGGKCGISANLAPNCSEIEHNKFSAFVEFIMRRPGMDAPWVGESAFAPLRTLVRAREIRRLVMQVVELRPG